MAAKPKPKSNRAKFTIAKKTDKPKEKPEAPKKEKKIEKIEEKQPEPQTTIQEKAPNEAIQEVTPTPEITHNAELLQTEQPAHQEPTSQNQTQDLSTNPFSVTMPTIQEHPTPEINENPFTPAEPMTNDQHLQTQPIEQSTQHTESENPELSSTLPKEDPLPRQSSFSSPVEVENNNKGKGIIIYFIIVAFIAFLVGIGSMALFTYGFSKMGTGPKLGMLHFMTKATPTPTKVAKLTTPTAAPTKALDLSTYNIKILNGSGITGEASKLKTELTTDGFTVVSTGNADKSDYTDTVIASKKDINPDYLNKLKEVLKKEFNLAQDTQLSDTEAKEADVVITIGSTAAK